MSQKIKAFWSHVTLYCKAVHKSGYLSSLDTQAEESNLSLKVRPQTKNWPNKKQRLWSRGCLRTAGDTGSSIYI